MELTNECEVCGNTYDKPMIIEIQEVKHVFDCFECAIHLLAPVCAHCNCRIVGHGSEADGLYFCCAHCAKMEGKKRIRDNERSGIHAA